VPAETLADRRLDLLRRKLELLRALQPQAGGQPGPQDASPGALAAWVTGGREMQARHLDLVDEAFVGIADGTHDRVMLTMPPRHGKLIAHDEPVPTPTGWRRHGDLKPGDEVFHPSGRVIRVVATSPDGEASMRVSTSDGGSVVVHPAHEWTVYDRARGKWRTLETRQLKARSLVLRGKKDRYTIQLPHHDVLECPYRPLPMDPYTLGVWLGDGTTMRPAVTHDPADIFEIPYEVSSRQVHATTGVVTTYYAGLRSDLKATGVMGNKHIPDAYLWAAPDDRWALLEGLIDTDGSVGTDGRVRFINANEGLARQVVHLVRSLGYRASWNVAEPTLSSSGIQGVQRVYVVGFSPYDGRIPARLRRKQNKADGRCMRRRIGIVSVEPVESRPGRCIEVDSEDGLYLVSEHLVATHNSRRASRWGPLWYLRRFPDRRVALASYGAELANEHGRWVRDTIDLHGGDEGTLDIGLRLRPTSKAANRWDLVGHDGGMVTTGIGGVLTGRGMHLGICDDPFKDAADASSPTVRRRAWDWWQSTFLTRLEPGGAVILILTRWHDDDIAGRLLADAEEASRWRVINLPAVAEKADDALGRIHGEALWPERYDEEALTEIRRRVGGRVWNALYQQRPAPPEGAVWKRAWIRYCPPAGMPALSMTVVSVDPATTSADNSDDTGIITLGRGSGSRADEVFVLADDTCHESPAGWGRTACLAALRHGADGFVVEDNQGGEMCTLVLKTAWAELRREGVTGQRAMPSVKRVRSRVNKRIRAEPVAALYEQGGRVWHVGELADLEDQLCSWSGDGDSPDRLDALVHGVTNLMRLGGVAVLSRPTGSLGR
jgi:hypothetical protein